MSRLSMITIVVAAATALATGCSSSGSTAGSGDTASGAQSTASVPATPTSATAAPSSTPTSGPASSAPPAAAVDSPYYAVALGNTWKYKITYPAPIGVVDQTVTVVRIAPGADGSDVTMKNDFHYRNGNTPDASADLTWTFHDDGSLTVPYQTTGISSVQIKVLSGSITWPTPADFDAGRGRRGNLKVRTTVGSTSATATVDARIDPAGTTAVTVPAGRFTGVRKMTEHLSLTATVSGVTTPAIDVDVTVYLAPGVGPVKTDFGSIAGAGAGTSVLVSYDVQ